MSSDIQEFSEETCGKNKKTWRNLLRIFEQMWTTQMSSDIVLI